MTTDPPITEADLHAYADGRLAKGRRAQVDAWLATRPEEAERVAQYRNQRELLHALYDPVLDEPVPNGDASSCEIRLATDRAAIRRG